jgi:hypothetical protein
VEWGASVEHRYLLLQSEVACPFLGEDCFVVLYRDRAKNICSKSKFVAKEISRRYAISGAQVRNNRFVPERVLANLFHCQPPNTKEKYTQLIGLPG